MSLNNVQIVVDMLQKGVNKPHVIFDVDVTAALNTTDHTWLVYASLQYISTNQHCTKSVDYSEPKRYRQLVDLVQTLSGQALIIISSR